MTSSAIRAQPSSRPAVSSRLSSSTTPSTGNGPKVSRLGAKKATTAINFEEAQKKAQEEEERIKRLGYDKLREEEEARALKEREAEEKRKKAVAGESVSRTATPVNGGASRAAEKVVPARLGFGQTAGAAAPQVVKT